MKKNSNSSRKSSTKNSKGGENSFNSSKYAHIQPVYAQPLEVKVYDNFDRAFKAFRTLVQKEKVLSIYKEKQHYEKPSDKKRRKRNEMKRKLFELQMKEESGYEYKPKKNKEREEE